MTPASQKTFVLVTDVREHGIWLAGALREEGEIITADHTSLDRVLQLVDVSGAVLVFVSLTQASLRQQIALLEGLVETKPLLPVVALADTPDQELLLAALRAGARDFISPGLRSGDLVGLLHRVLERARPPMPGRREMDIAWNAAVVSAHPGSDAPMFALHLALAIQKQSASNKVLLLDLGVPPGDTLMYLGIQCSYSFADAIRSLRRLDATLIDTAFGKHKSGLHLLAMPDDPQAVMGDITPTDVSLLLSTLQRYFTHVVVNLGGMPSSDFLYLLLARIKRIFLMVEQSVPSCKQNMKLLLQLRENRIPLESIQLVIDRYLPNMPPDAGSIAMGFNLPAPITLPPSGIARLTMMNTGESLFDAAPRDPYSVTLQRLAQDVTGSTEAPRETRGALAALRSLIRRYSGDAA
ncbi:MAG: hypothetical protein M0Z99_35085 [Betaproteobacteria bacterium]|nr:hypothetical protein [Betaproteobacteria bacterium]